MRKILLAEDDSDFSNVLKHYLQLHDFEVICATNGEEALKIFKQTVFDICILDVMMPVLDGFSLAEKLISINPETPFIFLTAKKLKEDKIRGLQLGADDYIVKPFEVDELILRLNNILKRYKKPATKINSTKDITLGKYIFDTKRLTLNTENSFQQLTEKEALLIYFLYENKNQLLKRETILKAVWNNDDFFTGRSMDVFISRIRKYFQDEERISIESKRFIGLEFKITE